MIEHLIKYKWWHLCTWIILSSIILSIPNFSLFHFSTTYGTLKYPLLTSLPFNMLLFYGNHYLLDKKIFITNRKIASFLLNLSILAILLLLVKTIIDVFWVNYYFDLLVKHKELTDKKGIILLMLVLNALSHFIILFCSFAVGFIIQYSISRKKNQQLTEAKLQAEISFLKMQLNPHLLFNTLNHFYALALKDKNKGLADGITQLSEMMRYMLYETNVEKIPLNKEITYIQSYLDLFAMRLHSNRADWIDFKSEGDIDQFRIAPMLLISFVENALKHGKKGDSKEKIRIHLKAKSNQLHFQTINKIDSCNGVSKDTEGVGMDNVKKRLDLIYPNAYDLRINQDSNHFSVHLKLESL